VQNPQQPHEVIIPPRENPWAPWRFWCTSRTACHQSL